MLSLGLVNIYNEGRLLYIFHRVGKELHVLTEKSFFPYFYETSLNGIYRGYFGEKLEKIICKEPYQLAQKRTKTSQEADIVYTKRYLIDKIKIEKANIRYVFFDIETQSKNLPNPFEAPDPISCITTYDNYTQIYKTFWIKDYQSEYQLTEEFIKYLKEIKPDLLLGWNALGFDFPYLQTRIPDFAQRISPIEKVIKKNGFPAGISIIDYMDWVKKVYKYKKYSLEYVYCDTFKLPYKPQKYEFGMITDDIKEKNIADVRKMVELEQKLKVLPYFDELRRLSKVLWEDLTMYSILVDGFILQIAKEKGFILPTKPDDEEKFRRTEEDEIVGGYVYAKSGVFDNVHLFDVGGTYPNLIITFNLDPANKRKEPNIQTTTIRNVHILQNANAIIPTVCSKLLHSRKEIQKQLELAKGEEADLLKKKDEAHKALNNSVYGITLFKSSRLYDKDIAATITYLARFLIRYTKWTLKQYGYEVIASDTDSIFVCSEFHENIEKIINERIIPAYLKHFGKTEGTLKFKYEGTFKNIFMLTKKHYAGNFIKANGEEKLIKKGIEALRSDASIFQEKFQETLLTKILNKESKKAIILWIKEQIDRIETLPLTDIAFPVKLSKSREAYKTEGMHVRALRYAQMENLDWQVNVGQDYYYTFIVPEREDITKGSRTIKGIKKEVDIKKPIDVMAFDEFNGLKNHTVDYTKVIDRNIYKKVETIFDALGWDISEIK